MVKEVRTLTGKVYYVSEPTRNEFDFKFLTTTELYLLSEEEQEKYLKDAKFWSEVYGYIYRSTSG